MAKRRTTGAARKQTRKVVGMRARPRPRPDPVRFEIRALDPLRKCGPGTSVEVLLRVDEHPEGAPARAHLVFYDRHGWYCEHGRNCPAVPPAQREARRLGFTERRPPPHRVQHLD